MKFSVSLSFQNQFINLLMNEVQLMLAVFAPGFIIIPGCPQDITQTCFNSINAAKLNVRFSFTKKESFLLVFFFVIELFLD